MCIRDSGGAAGDGKPELLPQRLELDDSPRYPEPSVGDGGLEAWGVGAAVGWPFAVQTAAGRAMEHAFDAWSHHTSRSRAARRGRVRAAERMARRPLHSVFRSWAELAHLGSVRQSCFEQWSAHATRLLPPQWTPPCARTHTRTPQIRYR